MEPLSHSSIRDTESTGEHLKATICLLALALFVSCGSRFDAGAPSLVPVADDLQWLDTLRALDEKSNAILGAAKFQSTHQELIAFADDAAHAHRERGVDVKKWRASWFPTETQNVVFPDCAQRDFGVSAKASDLEILDTLIAHRQCGLSHTNEALENVRSAGARHLLEEAFQTYTTELQQLRAWRTAWQ